MSGTPPRLVGIDIDGTLTDGVGGPLLPQAVAAMNRLRRVLPLRIITNTTSWPFACLARSLRDAGLLADDAELVMPAVTASQVLVDRGEASGILLADPGASEDYDWFHPDPRGPTVLLATEAHGLRIADLQPAFRVLLGGGKLYTCQQNRYFRRGGEPVTDLGPVAAFLSYASGIDAINVGKPSRFLFEALAATAGIPLAAMAMVGDDAEFDAAGAVALGMQGVLVRTGKYRPGDEDRVTPRPTVVLDGIGDLPAWLGV